VPDRLLDLEDGTRVELDASGASLARVDIESELDDPPALIVGEKTLHAALDTASNWQLGDGLLALADARFDVPHLRFADFSLTLEFESTATLPEGTGMLLLEPAGAAPLEIALNSARAADCTARAKGALTVERHGDSLTLGSKGATCTSSRLTGHVGLALRIDRRTHITSLSIKRL
jgi:hypothetical protein